ncbi:MAG: hypothetical protein WAS07_06540 [Micropruina sp.]|nr:hypothetical protein [Micropruina sp.]
MTDPEAAAEIVASYLPAASAGLSSNEALGHYVTMWKTTVEVQQHFNDIEWRIRGLALTVATFALGAAGVAAKDGATLGPISLGSAVLCLGLILWYAFYFVDRLWYHPLLKAAVAEGTEFEKAIRRHLPEAHMTAGITERSPQSVGWLVAFLAGPKGTDRVNGHAVMHSDHKLRWFYRVGASTFIIGAIALQIGVALADGAARAENPGARAPAASPATPTVHASPGTTP